MTQLSTTHKDGRLSADVIEEIIGAVSSIDYGSVEIVIHDRKVVQIECRKKIRINPGESNRKTVKL